MIKGMLTAFGIVAVIFIVCMFMFKDKLRDMRERENSIYQKLFKKGKKHF